MPVRQPSTPEIFGVATDLTNPVAVKSTGARDIISLVSKPRA